MPKIEILQFVLLDEWRWSALSDGWEEKEKGRVQPYMHRNVDEAVVKTTYPCCSTGLTRPRCRDVAAYATLISESVSCFFDDEIWRRNAVLLNESASSIKRFGIGHALL